MAYTHQMTTSVGLRVNPLVANSGHGGRQSVSEHGSGRSKTGKPCRSQWRCCTSLLHFSALRTEPSAGACVRSTCDSMTATARQAWPPLVTRDGPATDRARVLAPQVWWRENGCHTVRTWSRRSRNWPQASSTQRACTHGKRPLPFPRQSRSPRASTGGGSTCLQRSWTLQDATSATATDCCTPASAQPGPLRMAALPARVVYGDASRLTARGTLKDRRFARHWAACCPRSWTSNSGVLGLGIAEHSCEGNRLSQHGWTCAVGSASFCATAHGSWKTVSLPAWTCRSTFKATTGTASTPN